MSKVMVQMKSAEEAWAPSSPTLGCLVETGGAAGQHDG